MPTDTNGDHDVVDLLVAQHHRIRELFAEVKRTRGSRRREAFERLVRLLAVHETAEEQLVHPLAGASLRGGRDIVRGRLAEEREAKETLVLLEKLGPDAPEFPALLATFSDDVLEHAKHEETEEFRLLREKVPAFELRALVPLVKAAEAIAPTHPHPGVESATLNNLAGPVLSVFDRTKDLARKALGTGDRA